MSSTFLGVRLNGVLQGGVTGAVSSITGTTNQVIATAATGDVTLSLPQSIAVASDVTFNSAILSANTAKAMTYSDASKKVVSTGAPTNGQLLVGDTGNIPALATLTGTTNQVVVTNAAHSITLSTPQDIATASTPTFGGLTLAGQLVMAANTIQFTDVTAVYGGAANILDIRNGTSATLTRFLNTYTDATHNEYFSIDWQTQANILTMQTQKGSAGGTARVWNLRYGGIAANAMAIPIATTSPVDLSAGIARSSVCTTGAVAVSRSSTLTATSGTHPELSVTGSFAPTANNTTTYIGVNVAPSWSQTSNNSTGGMYSVYINPTINLSTAGTKSSGHDALRIAVVETALGTGAQNLINAMAGTSGTTPIFSVSNAGVTTWADAANLVFGSSSGTKIGTATTQKIGFYNVTPIIQPSAYTQTYSTTTKTHSNPTAAAVATTGAALTSYGYTESQANAIVTAVNALVIDMVNVKSVLNAAIDDLQALGLAA